MAIKMLEALDSPDGKEEACELATQRDEKERSLEVSHFRHCKTDGLCIEVSHFDIEPKATDFRRMAHQNGNVVRNRGDKPCIVNCPVGEKMYDDEGNHVGRERVKGRAKVQQKVVVSLAFLVDTVI